MDAAKPSIAAIRDNSNQVIRRVIVEYNAVDKFKVWMTVAVADERVYGTIGEWLDALPMDGLPPPGFRIARLAASGALLPSYLPLSILVFDDHVRVDRSDRCAETPNVNANPRPSQGAQSTENKANVRSNQGEKAPTVKASRKRTRRSLRKTKKMNVEQNQRSAPTLTNEEDKKANKSKRVTNKRVEETQTSAEVSISTARQRARRKSNCVPNQRVEKTQKSIEVSFAPQHTKRESKCITKKRVDETQQSFDVSAAPSRAQGDLAGAHIRFGEGCEVKEKVQVECVGPPQMNRERAKRMASFFFQSQTQDARVNNVDEEGGVAEGDTIDDEERNRLKRTLEERGPGFVAPRTMKQFKIESPSQSRSNTNDDMRMSSEVEGMEPINESSHVYEVGQRIAYRLIQLENWTPTLSNYQAQNEQIASIERVNLDSASQMIHLDLRLGHQSQTRNIRELQHVRWSMPDIGETLEQRREELKLRVAALQSRENVNLTGIQLHSDNQRVLE